METKKRILVIEDNLDICDLIEMMLSEDYDVVALNDIKKAKARNDIDSFDLIISDFLIGDSSAEEIVENMPVKKFIVITALSIQNPKVRRLAEMPNVSYIQKPFELEEFKRAVSEAVS